MKIFNNFLLAMSRFSDFNSRSRRAEFWGFALVTALIGMAASRWDSMIFGDYQFVESMVDFVLFIPSIAVGARRLHDTGRSGWWQLIAFTGIGWIFLLIWWAQDGEYTDNKWGRNPKLSAEDYDYNERADNFHDDQIV